MRNSFFFRKVYTMSGKFWDGSWLGLAHLHTFTGWWFGTFFVVPSYMVIIIPTDELIFFRGVGWNYQPDVHLPMIDVPWPSSRHPWPSSRHGFSPCQGLGHGVSPGMWIAGCPRMWGVRGETPAVSSGLATQPCLIRKMVVLTGYFYGFGAWILGRFRDNTRWESHGRCAEGRFETHWLWVHYGNMVRIFGKILPKGAVCFGNAANFRRWLKPSFACFWTPGVEKRFRHVMTSVHAPQNPQKSEENTMEHYGTFQTPWEL